MSKGGDSEAAFGYSIHVAEAVQGPKGFSYEGVQYVDLHGPDGVERIWERGADAGAQGTA
jgi:hypothetical protein